MAIYSGRPDPVWMIHPRHGSFKKIREHLNHVRASGNTYRQEHLPSHLGYKGFLVHPPDDEQAHLIVGRETAHLQKALLDTMPEGLISNDLRQKISRAIHSGDIRPNVPDASQVTLRRDTSQIPSKRVKVGDKIQHYAPKLNLPRWNEHFFIRFNNNCYNYGNDKITNSFAQPGDASGNPFADYTNEDLLSSAESDGLVPMDVADNDPCPEAPEQPNCLVALFVAPG